VSGYAQRSGVIRLIQQQLGPYHIEARIGSGGSAEVYKAYQPSMRRHVAIKTLSPDLLRDESFVRNFQREAILIAGLSHSHILPVFDYGQHDGYAYLAMPLMENGTIASRVRGKRLPIDQVIRVGVQVGDALHYAHTRGLVHRDVKPGNILLDTHGNCLLSDFGIAQLTAQANATEHRGFVGTPGYTAPEQLDNGKVDGRADQYALGVVLYELATGRRPFEAADAYSLSYQHLNTEPRPPADINQDVPAALNEIIVRTLAKRPFERFETMAIMVNALRAVKLDAQGKSAASGDDMVSLDTPVAAPDAQTLVRKSAKQAARAASKPQAGRVRLALPRLPDVRKLAAAVRPRRDAQAQPQHPKARPIAPHARMRISANAPSPRRARFDPAQHSMPIAAAGVVVVVAFATVSAQLLRAWVSTPVVRAEPTITIVEPVPATQPPPTPAPTVPATPIPVARADAQPAVPTETPIGAALTAGQAGGAVVQPRECPNATDPSIVINDLQRAQLGCPSQAFVPSRQVAVQAFERGVMVLFARVNNSNPTDSNGGALYVLADDGRAWRFNSAWRGGSGAQSDGLYSCSGVAGASPAQTGIPWRHFGQVWCEIDAIRNALGAAKGDEVPNAQAAFQSFANGRAFRINGWGGHPSVPSDRAIVVILAPEGGRWRASGD
jgi:serine/threonine-protein kinase